MTSCFGHIRDLVKKNFGIEKENNYNPVYEVTADKRKVVAELKKQTKSAGMIWLASDEDREGEAIAWHLAEELKLEPGKMMKSLKMLSFMLWPIPGASIKTWLTRSKPGEYWTAWWDSSYPRYCGEK